MIFKEEIYSLTKEVLEVNINFWQETTKIELMVPGK